MLSKFGSADSLEAMLSGQIRTCFKCREEKVVAFWETQTTREPCGTLSYSWYFPVFAHHYADKDETGEKRKIRQPLFNTERERERDCINKCVF